MNKEYIEAFNRIALHTEYDNDSPYDSLCFDDDCKLVDDALYRLEEIEKVLEIIKEKEVRLWQLRVSTDLESYNYHCLEEEELTQEEYELLRRYFK